MVLLYKIDDDQIVSVSLALFSHYTTRLDSPQLEFWYRGKKLFEMNTIRHTKIGYILRDKWGKIYILQDLSFI